MFPKNWRNITWDKLEETWDIVVVGGGITGAGILREATRAKLKVLLVEQRDFAWGTSSRSSKLVHGGLRYLATGQVGLTLESVREREALLEDGAGLIDPLGFLIATHKGDSPGKLTYSAGLAIYDLLALQWTHRYYKPEEFRMLAPHINTENLKGGFRYGDAQTDDARLTLRVIQEAIEAGGYALNYVQAQDLIREDDQVVGVRVCDVLTGNIADVKAKVVINATGAWADILRGKIGAEPKMRPLRGSHLVFPTWRLPVAQAIGFAHPLDGRPVFALPWEGATIIGTTDIDHPNDLNTEPRISPDEVAYLMMATHHQFPSRNITLDDVIGTWAGVRPVIGTGKDDPSKESRDYVIWHENGLLTVTGGKLTTFRAIAQNALKAVADVFPNMPAMSRKDPVLNSVELDLPIDLDERVRKRLLGRYARNAPMLVTIALPDELTTIPNTHTLWAELRWCARAEGVIHLDDLMLRRTRIGLLLPNGGAEYLTRIREICQQELGWDDATWEAEERAYIALWQAHYSLPARETIPNWETMLAERPTVAIESAEKKRKIPKWVAGMVLVILAWRLLRRRGAIHH